MPRTHDPKRIDFDLITRGFERRFGDASAELAERLQVVRLFVDGLTQEEVAVEMGLRVGQVARTLGFAMNLSTLRGRSARPDREVAAFASLNRRIQNVFAAEGITTLTAARALFDKEGHLTRILPKLGPKSIASIARWLGHSYPKRAASGARSLEGQLARAVTLLELHGYHVTTDSSDRTSTSPGLTSEGLPLKDEDLAQAAADLVEQSQIFQKSVCAGDESQNWMLAKVAGMREHLSRARSAILQTKVSVNHTPGQPIVFDSMSEPCSFGRVTVDFAQSQVEQRSL